MSPPAVLRHLRFFLDVPHTTGAELVPTLIREFEGCLERDEGRQSRRTTELVMRHVYENDDPHGFARALQARGVKLLLGRSPYATFNEVLTPEHVIVFLRDPVARVVAQWRADCVSGVFSGSLVEFANTPRYRNLQYRLLKGAPLRRLGFLGSSERYRESIERLRQIPNFASLSVELGQDAPVDVPYETTPAERTSILEANAHDVALYERAAFSREPQNVFTRLAHMLGSRGRPKREAPREKKARQRRATEAARRHKGPYAQGVLPLVSKERRLAVLFTQKAGCTFAVKWFFEQVGVLDEATAYSNWIHDYREQVFYASEGYRPEDIAAPGMRILKFVRNPFPRAVSSYVQASKMGYEDAKLQRFLGRPINKEQRYSFREFVAYLGSVDLRTCNVHHRLQVHPLEENGLIRPATLVPIEDSHTLLSELERQLELTQTNTTRLAASVHHTARSVDTSFCGDEAFVIPRGRVTMPSAEAFYDRDIERAVARLYREDFERYGYPPELDKSAGLNPRTR